MKKAIFLVVILALSVLTTACINNLAVQELNNKAAEYMKKGDYENAISRLKSSADLDPSIFETQYNLAVAYTENEDYKEAIETFNKALSIRPDSADAYYALAVMYENYASDLYSGETKEQKESLKTGENAAKSLSDEIYKPTAEEVENVKQYYNASIDSYNKYIELSKNSQTSADVKSHVEDLKNKLETLDFDTN